MGESLGYNSYDEYETEVSIVPEDSGVPEVSDSYESNSSEPSRPESETVHESNVPDSRENKNFVEQDIGKLRNKRKNTPGRIPENEIEIRARQTISKKFEDIRQIVFATATFDDFGCYDKEGNKQTLDINQRNYINNYRIAVFNDCANELTKYGNDQIPQSFYDDPEIQNIIITYIQKIQTGEEVNAENLIKELEEKLDDNADYLKGNIDEFVEKSESTSINITIDELGKITLTPEEEKNIDDILKNSNNGYTKKSLEEAYKKYKILKQKKAKGIKLEPKEEEFIGVAEKTFKLAEKKALKEIKLRKENRPHRRFNPKRLKFSEEYATGNMKEIKPWAIVMHNEQIRNYIRGDRKPLRNINKNISLSQLSPDEKRNLYTELKNKQNLDETFTEKYLDEYGEWKQEYKDNYLKFGHIIDPEKSIIENQTILNNKRNIDTMMEELAIKEQRKLALNENIKEMATRRASMICCFRAISSFFDTVNNNGENFANQFEIEDVNKNIEFDGKIIKMTGTIGTNKNHIGLYYNTETGELSFDNFLAYDPQSGYKIGKGNGETEKLKIKLPTMNDMEKVAQHSARLVENLPFKSLLHYDRAVGFAMSEAIRLNCFQGFMGADMQVNKQFIAQYTEKNILKQDIIKTIYSKFYNKNDIDEKLSGNLTISEGNEPEQFKLIKLISDSIDDCKNANQLLSFRNHINELDKLISSKDVVQNDDILRELFANDLSTNYDILDNTINKIENENTGNGISVNRDSQDTYEYNGNNNKQINTKKQDLNYYIFLNCLAENKGDKRIINLKEFETALNNIKQADRNLGDSNFFSENYEKYYEADQLLENI